MTKWQLNLFYYLRNLNAFYVSILITKLLKKMQSIKKISLFILLALCFMNMQCDEDDVVSLPNEICEETTVVSPSLYENLSSVNFTFVSAEITNDCLNLEVGASGCDSKSWGFKLVDSGAIAESSPEQRFLKFQLINDESCEAYFRRSVSFDLTLLQINGSNEIILHIEGLESSLNYKY